MNKNSTTVGKSIILTISYLFLLFAAQAKAVNPNFIQSKFSLGRDQDSVVLYTYSTFNITGNTKTVDLVWTTDSQSQDDYYEVERSFDRNNFKTIGLVLGPLNSDGQYSQFSFRDNDRNIKNYDIVYYRLKHVDMEGKFTYGSVKIYKVEKLSN